MWRRHGRRRRCSCRRGSGRRCSRCCLDWTRSDRTSGRFGTRATFEIGSDRNYFLSAAGRSLLNVKLGALSKLHFDTSTWSPLVEGGDNEWPGPMVNTLRHGAVQGTLDYGFFGHLLKKLLVGLGGRQRKSKVMGKGRLVKLGQLSNMFKHTSRPKNHWIHGALW